MSTQDSDGIDEALQGVTHVAMTAAARTGEQLARMGEAHARDAQARSQQAARENTERMRAERQAARASLTTVHRPGWWDTATTEDITNAYQTAKAWSEIDPEAVRAEQKIVQEVRSRYGVDVGRDAEPASVAEAIKRTDRAHAEAAEQRGVARGDRAEALRLMARADATDQAAEANLREQITDITDPQLSDVVEDTRERQNVDVLDPDTDPKDVNQAINEVAMTDFETETETETETGRAGEVRADAGYAYDSAERREAMAQGLDHIENRAAVQARVRSDVAQSRPATDAVTQAAGRAPKARKGNKGKGSSQFTWKVQRSGRSPR